MDDRRGIEDAPGSPGSPHNDPEDRHRSCWYSRRTTELPLDIGHHTIADGHLLFCAHPMLFPVVGYQFDIRNCASCDYYKPTRRL